MKIVIKMLDWVETLILHSIDVFAVYGNEFQPKQWVRLEQFPYIDEQKLFKRRLILLVNFVRRGSMWR